MQTQDFDGFFIAISREDLLNFIFFCFSILAIIALCFLVGHLINQYRKRRNLWNCLRTKNLLIANNNGEKESRRPLFKLSNYELNIYEVSYEVKDDIVIGHNKVVPAEIIGMKLKGDKLVVLVEIKRETHVFKLTSKFKSTALRHPYLSRNRATIKNDLFGAITLAVDESKFPQDIETGTNVKMKYDVIDGEVKLIFVGVA